MAGRPIGKLHQDDVRRKIQTSQLLNRLAGCALGDIELTQQQIKAIEILLRKSLPDLSSVTISGDESNPLRIETIKRLIVDPKPSENA